MTVSLLRRFPRLRTPTVSWPVIPPDKRDPYPALAADLAVLDNEVAPVYAEYDKAALHDQNSYRRQQVLIFLGSALVTGLGGLQAVFPGQRWPGLLVVVLGILLAGSTRVAKEEGMQAQYLDARVKAERLRGLHFQYLSRTGAFADEARVGAAADEARVNALRHAVIDIRAGKEPQ